MIFEMGSDESIYPQKINDVLKDIINQESISPKSSDDMKFIILKLNDFIYFYDAFLIEFKDNTYNLSNYQPTTEQIGNIFTLFKSEFEHLKSVEGVDFNRTGETLTLLLRQLPFFVSYMFDKLDYDDPTDDMISKRMEFFKYCFMF
jgi:hypothetical protein